MVKVQNVIIGNIINKKNYKIYQKILNKKIMKINYNNLLKITKNNQ